MVKEHYNALRAAGTPEDKAIEAVDALVKAVEGRETDRQVTKWAALAALGFLAAIAIKVFSL